MNFSGTNSDLAFNGTSLAGKNYTIFVVEMRRSSAGNAYFINGSDVVLNQTIVAGYATNNSFRIGHYGGTTEINYVIGNYTVPTPRIHTIHLNSDVKKDYYVNGALAVSCTNSPTNCRDLLTSYNGAYFGSTYVGDIGEIIIFNRTLTNNERESVEKYLSQKWKIKFGVIV